ncbi:MAG: dTDP-glucose 4,6-dehydratase [Anaerolineales bacterium]
MKNLLVTGGAGFIGSNFIHFVIGEDPDIRVVNIDLLTYAGNIENLNNLTDPERHIFVKGNICDSALVRRTIREQEIDTIVHFAAESHVDRSILDPGLFVQTNVVGTFTLLEAAREVWSNGSALSGLGENGVRFHHISTDEVYGSLEPDDPPFSETTSYAPNSPYAASKAASDHLVRAYGHTYGLPYTITNCSNNYGPFQFPEKMIPLMITNAVEGLDLPIYGDGSQIRDWLYVEDHCRAVWLVLKDGRPGETYNIGGDNQPTNISLVNLLCDLLDEYLPRSSFSPHRNLIKYVKDRPGHDRRYAMDISKINQKLGWMPGYTLEEGLKKTVEWYLDNPEWLSAVRKQESYREWMNRNYEKR